MAIELVRGPEEPKPQETAPPPARTAKTERPPVRTPSDPVPIPAPAIDGRHDLNQPGYYLNRELTWLNYCFRVLHEAEDPRTPLLERVKFVAIVASILDEFFMKRIGGLKQQVGAGMHARSVDGRTPRQQIDEAYVLIRELVHRSQSLLPLLFDKLADHGIRVTHYERLDAKQRTALREYYFHNIFPLVTPQATDPAHPFPFISNLSLNLLVTLRYPTDTELNLARVKVPVGAGSPRFLQVDGYYVLLEDVMAHNLDLLFPGMIVESCEHFRVTRNANTERDEEQAEDLLSMIESELRDRKFAPVVRLQVAKSMQTQHRGMLAAELGLDEQADVFEAEEMLALADLMEIARLDVPALRDPPHHPIDHPALNADRNIFHVIRDVGPILLQHPYESYASSVERFLREASEDPKVRAIKMTLYRTSAESKAITYLINAARNGKQVAVVVELKARFDEAANIRWANRLEEVGIHVTYGVVGLKTHCKVILVVRQDYSGLRRYAHIGTGNYHAGTARTYCDLGLLTCDDPIGQDLTELFNYLTTGYKPNRIYQKLLPAPKTLKKTLLDKIEREIQKHRPDQPGLIQFKMNALEDVDITRALYRAAQAGVHIDLIVRDTCRLRPGIPGLSQHVRVLSIVSRFLEHTRLYYFRNGGDEEYFLGSADCMKRNLESRIEVIVPVEASALRTELRRMLDVQLGDNRSAWEMQPDGSYVQRRAKRGQRAVGAQEVLVDRAEKRGSEANRLRKRRPRGISRRNLR